MFDVVGDVLDYIISPTGKIARPRMMSAVAHALLWFHEGCRETVTHMAIVNFSASLDALAGGGKSGGIRRLINARLGIEDDKPIRQGRSDAQTGGSTHLRRRAQSDNARQQ